MSKLECTVELSKDRGITIEVVDADTGITQSIRMDGTTLIMKVVGKDATSTFTQTADGIAINCKNFSIEAETVTTGGVASAAIDEPSPPSSAG